MAKAALGIACGLLGAVSLASGSGPGDWDDVFSGDDFGGPYGVDDSGDDFGGPYGVDECTVHHGTFCCNHLKGIGLSGVDAGSSVEECIAKCQEAGCTSGYWHPPLNGHDSHCKLYLEGPTPKYPLGSQDPFCTVGPHAPETTSFACNGHKMDGVSECPPDHERKCVKIPRSVAERLDAPRCAK